MKHITKGLTLTALSLSLLIPSLPPVASALAPAKNSAEIPAGAIADVIQINPTTVEVRFTDGTRMSVDFYADNIFRLFRDDKGGIIRNPSATPPAEILTATPRASVSSLQIERGATDIAIVTPAVRLSWDKASGMLAVSDLRRNKQVLTQTSPATFDKGKTSISFAADPSEYFYGGGVQNGRFSHKGKTIAIENENSWTDGGVASPVPFYWSTGGYGIMFHTFGKGKYDFGASDPKNVKLTHVSDYLDAFVMVDETPESLLADFYQLTGKPVLLPKFGFYEGHLNAYNRDYWKEDSTGILFEDGKRYRESQRDNGGVKESLNGELDNYQFSARAVVDRYAAHDMPLGWVLPNDGYGAGYGQTETLDGNIRNLREFGDYARSKGVEIGLWTQSNLHPDPEASALLQRDIVKEVRDAGVRVLKTDVAWVGYGYSFGLNGVADVAQIMPYYGNDARPFIISLDGWAGTQRYAGIWSGDQTGGEWEYIRFHIPTYIGSGLSGNPNITSDMDGIFGGKNPVVNIRDFQWKTFTPMQLNMDGWGTNEKYPHALGEPAASINRNYLKLKSELLPYAYTFAREAVDGKPLIRAMFLDYPSDFTYSPATRYQYLYGPWFLVAPVYQSTAADDQGNDRRDGIYLPEGEWIDYLTGDIYSGDVVLNYFDAPIWKLPVFVKRGAIIPRANANNNPSEIDASLRIFEIYPHGSTSFTQYDDDGTTEAYRDGKSCVTTVIKSDVSADGNATITIDAANGSFAGYDPRKATELIVNVTKRPKSVTATVGGKKVKLHEAASEAKLSDTENAWFYSPAQELNNFSTPGSDYADFSVKRNPAVIVRISPVNVNETPITVTVKGYAYNRQANLATSHGALTQPVATVAEDKVDAYSVTPSWAAVENADYYDIEFDDMLYTNIRGTEYTFIDLLPETDYTFRLRAVNADGASDWTDISAITKSNPLEFAIDGIRGEVNVAIQPGFEVSRLFDFAETGDMFHTLYRAKATPFEIIADLRGNNTLDKFWYLPGVKASYGTFIKGRVDVSLDKEHWTPAGTFDWERTPDTKVFEFTEKPLARYIKVSVDSAFRDFGSGRELYVFRVPGTESQLAGDVNKDGRIDINDFISYTNYNGLRAGDSDFEGYISDGDINRNGLIDVYDISVVATSLDGGVDFDDYAKPLSGKLSVDIPTAVAAPGDTIKITVSGKDLQAVNAVSFELPYNPTRWKFAGIKSINTLTMTDLTYDRRHTDGSQALYPTFVNEGDRETINSAVAGVEEPLFTIEFVALQRGRFDSKPANGFLVDKKLNTIKF